MPFELHDVCPLLQVFDMPTSLAFYRDVLGFEVVAAAPPAAQVGADQFDWVHVRRDGADLMLNAVYERDAPRPPTPSSSRVAAHDDTALFISCSDVDEAYEHLRARGITVDPPTDTSYGMRQLYAKDPDGFVICFQRPVDAAARKTGED